MRWRLCCPPWQGCNDPTGPHGDCWLERLRRLPTPDARRALRHWQQARVAPAGSRQARAERRAYQRARDEALLGRRVGVPG